MAYTTIDDPTVYFTTTLYTGNGSANHAITNDANAGNFQPDILWYKSRSYASSHILYDSSRTKTYFSTVNTTAQDKTDANMLVSFDANGFTLNADTDGNRASNTFVGWQWKVNGGTTSSNTTGGLNSTVQVNATAGISMFTFTADGTANSIGHGLGSKPDLVIFKSRNVGGGHLMATDLLDGGMDYLYLNLPNAAASLAYAVPTSTLVEYNDNNTNTQIAYAFKNIQGYSKFGTYYGNGIADGPFAYCGFKPAWVMIKNTGSSEPWVIFDTKRDPYHQPDAHNKLVANSHDAENGHSATGGSGYNNIDILSTGFKLVTNNGATNESGKRFLFMTFAESPFVSSEGIPTTGR
jgi:hypothetical protein